MSMIWIICGAGRGVGKTTLARNICKILPGSVYAKCGYCESKPHKPKNYFNSLDDLKSFIETARTKYDYIIAESNALACLQYGDFTVYVDGIPEKTDFRDDIERLKKLADLKITRGESSNNWKKILRAILDNNELLDAVCDCLVSQKRYIFGSVPKVKSKLWFEASGSRVFGRGLAGLLKNIESLGTLQNAAKASNMSYRYAWNMIHVAEENLGKTLVIRSPGGRHGGTSELSKDGRKLLEVFRQLNDEVAAFADKRFSQLINMEKVDV